MALERALRLEGFAVRTAADGRGRRWRRVAEAPPAAIVLDVVLPDLDGREVAARLRASGDDTPICILSARDEVADRVAGLQAGADDYLVKPFAIEELVARLQALLRRGAPKTAGATLSFGDLRVDPRKRLATRAGAPLELTRREFDLLEAFARHPGLVLDPPPAARAGLGIRLGGGRERGGRVRRLPASQARGGRPARIVQTVRGVGFVLRDP